MTDSRTFTEAVRQYWEADDTVSIIDRNLHEIEIATVLRYLASGDRVADIGCGDGTATIRYAGKVRECIAIERSDRLRQAAGAAIESAGVANVRIIAGDVLDLSDVPAGSFDAIVTERVLINLASWEEQQRAIRNVHRLLKPGGRYLMVENTNQGMQAMNDARHEVGLDPVPQHWHNRFFDHDDLIAFLAGHFQVVRHHDFGLYYLLTRVFEPMFASFTGYGTKAVKDPIYDRADAAARRLFELWHDRIAMPGGPAFGPIQLFVLRREGPDW